jgi:glycosyltransferase involved in cell wall biosynthesis
VLKNIAYVLHGNYAFVSRAKKQVAALTKSGHRVKVFNGIFNPPGVPLPATNDRLSLCIHQGRFPLINFMCLFIGFNVRVAKTILDEKIEFDHIICRELSTLLAGVFIKSKNHEAKLIFDSNELSVEVHSGMKKQVWNLIQKVCLPYCDIIIHAEKNRLKYFVHRYKIDTKRQPNILLENFPYYNSNQFQRPLGQVKILYFGGIGPNRGIEEMVQAFAELPDFQLDLMGFGGTDYLQHIKEQIHNWNATNMRILPPIDDSLIYNVFPSYTAGIAFYPHTELNNYFCAPNKVYQYLQGGMAVITTDNPGLRERLERYKIGICLKDITPGSIKRAIKKIVELRYCDNITAEIKRKYSWEAIENIFLSIFNESHQ